MVSFKKLFKVMDFYGSQVYLNINNQKTYNTALGGLLTLFTLTIAALFFGYFSVDMISKKNPQLISYKKYISNKLDFPKLEETNFFIAYDIWYQNKTRVDLEKNDYFSIKVFEDSGNSIYRESEGLGKEIPIGECSQKMLTNFTNLNPKLINLILNEFHCLKFNGNHIYGSLFTSLNINYINFSIKANFKKLIRDFGSLDNSIVMGAFPLNIRLFYQTYSYDPDNFSDPFVKILSFSHLYLTPFEQTWAYAGFSLGESVRDDDWLFESINSTLLYRFENIFAVALNNDFLIKYSVQNDEYVEFLNFFTYIEYYKEIYKRRYLNLKKSKIRMKFLLRNSLN